MSAEERFRKENQEKKKKWYNEKGFLNAVQKKSPITEIPNYVNLDHYGESAITHKFRDDIKSKVIDKKRNNFIV